MSEVQKGYYIPMNSMQAVQECLESGVYGQFIKKREKLTSQLFKILADYTGMRPGDHVFFFQDKRIYYGGQLQASDGTNTIFLNGVETPFDIDSPDSLFVPNRREDDVDDDGVFEQETRHETVDKHQPFLVSFVDQHGLRGREIRSDVLNYYHTEDLPFPTPASEMNDVGFCALTPRETNLLLEKFEETDQQIPLSSDRQAESQPDILDSLPSFPLSILRHPCDSRFEAEIEAWLLADHNRLPGDVDADSSAVIRQVPMSARRPRDGTDAVDIGIYDADSVFPHTAYELKRGSAGKGTADQVSDYVTYPWRHDDYPTTSFYVYAPEFTGTFCQYFSSEQHEKLYKYAYEKQQDTTLNTFV